LAFDLAFGFDLGFDVGVVGVDFFTLAVAAVGWP
jgi:hypothetical protein